MKVLSLDSNQISMLPLYFRQFLTVVFACCLIACTTGEQTDTPTQVPVEIRGVYGNPKPLWDKSLALDELGVNAIFVHSGSITEEMVQQARSEGARVFAEFATLNGKKYVETHPEAWAINEQGERVEAASWFMGVCPTEPGFRQYRQNQLRDLLSRFELDGVWLDYIHWHAQFEEPEPILPETCFCDHCMETFAAARDLQLPEGNTPEQANWILTQHDRQWRDWRCQVIIEWVKDMRQILKEMHPQALLGLYHCPWNDEEFEGARRRILGLDYDMLREFVDVFSPMVYHGRMERKPEWVAENITWFSDRINAQPGNTPKIWPIVQAYDDPEPISPQEFEQVLLGGLAGASSGVMMFTATAVAKNNPKTEMMKKVYKELRPCLER